MTSTSRYNVDPKHHPESPPFEPKASTSQMNPPPPPKADMTEKPKVETKGDKKSEHDTKPEEKKFKPKRFVENSISWHKNSKSKIIYLCVKNQIPHSIFSIAYF